MVTVTKSARAMPRTICCENRWKCGMASDRLDIVRCIATMSTSARAASPESVDSQANPSYESTRVPAQRLPALPFQSRSSPGDYRRTKYESCLPGTNPAMLRLAGSCLEALRHRWRLRERCGRYGRMAGNCGLDANNASCCITGAADRARNETPI